MIYHLQLVSSTTSLVVNSLEPFTSYTIAVAAQTTVATGPYSQAVSVMTMEDGEKNWTMRVLTTCSIWYIQCILCWLNYSANSNLCLSLQLQVDLLWMLPTLPSHRHSLLSAGILLKCLCKMVWYEATLCQFKKKTLAGTSPGTLPINTELNVGNLHPITLL